MTVTMPDEARLLPARELHVLFHLCDSLEGRADCADEVAVKCGRSLPTVREALQFLEGKGLITQVRPRTEFGGNHKKVIFVNGN